MRRRASDVSRERWQMSETVQTWRCGCRRLLAWASSNSLDVVVQATAALSLGTVITVAVQAT